MNDLRPTGPTREPDGRQAQYSVGTLEKGLSVLELLEGSPTPLSIQEVVKRSGIQRAAVFRLLCTFEQRGYVERLVTKKYRAMFRRRRWLVGYGAPLSGTEFRGDVYRGIQGATEQRRLDLVALDNPENSAEEALRRVREFAERHVDLCIVFQPNESIGHIVSDALAHAGVPFISIDQPLHGGIYFGANNYQAGKMAGEALGQFAIQHWHGHVDRVVLIESSWSSGSNGQARVTGVLVGLRHVLGPVPESRVIRLDGKAHRDSSRDAVQALLTGLDPHARLLIAGFNDPCAVGALEAIRAAGREEYVAIVGQNATKEGRWEIRKRNSRLIASIAYFPETYGAHIVELALSIMNGEQVPPAVYTTHTIVNRENIDHFYGAADAASGSGPDLVRTAGRGTRRRRGTPADAADARRS